LRFYIVDVFAESRLAGNQLAVFRDCSDLSTQQMQAIAKEMHFSETTFITSEVPRDGGYDVRIFTPNYELPFAGHPTLGTAYVIQSEIIGKPVKAVKLNYKVGQIPVEFSYAGSSPDVLWMRQKPPTFGRTFDRGRVAKVLGLNASDIDPEFPVQLVSTGVPFVLVPLRSLKAIRGIRIDQAALAKLFKETDTTLIFPFTRETYSKKNQLNARGLGLPDTIQEDPATGSANGCLAGYLVKHSFFGKPEIDIRVEQGYEVNRRSLLLLRAKKAQNGIEVNVGGRVQFVAKGEFPE
jgi:trans-2,3-dihydro-3-hydroxyanthranilate isomerase